MTSARPGLRMILPLAAMSAVLLLVGGLAASYLHRLQGESLHLLDESVGRVQAAEELEITSHELRYQIRQQLSAHDERSLAAITEQKKQADFWLSKAREVADTGRERALIRQIEQGYARLFTEFRKALDSDAAEEHRQAVLGLIHDMASKEILRPAREWLDLNRQRMASIGERNQAIADRMGAGLLLLGMCGAVAGLLTGYGIARGIHRSIAQLTIPVRDAAGRLNEVVGPITVSSGATFEELETALGTMAERVGAAVKQLQESQLAAARVEQMAAMGQLAAGLAHELRNPLTSMKMLVQPGGDAEESVRLDADDMAVLRQEIDRLEQTIQTFLDYARPPRLAKRSVLLRDLIEQTVNFLGRRAQQSGIEIRSEFPEEIVPVEADAGQIRQVLLNLLLNAIDVSSKGESVGVRMRCEPPGDSDGGTHTDRASPPGMIIEVADRGSGLPAELGERIFEPFVSTKDGGTGLGLPICKRIVEDHGGEITARNRDGGGAIFTIRLPVASQSSKALKESTENEQDPQM